MVARRAALVIVVLASVAVIAACGGKSGQASVDAYGERNPVTVTGNAVTVALKNIQFVPQGIKVRPGTTVTWVNDDSVVHNVSEIHSVFLSPDVMKPGDRFSFTFDKPGVYRYQCTFHHPLMNGVVIVEKK
ncbi:MAG: cupredoxin domain-containing protein [Dehalococcoidia bacterium]